MISKSSEFNGHGSHWKVAPLESMDFDRHTIPVGIVDKRGTQVMPFYLVIHTGEERDQAIVTWMLWMHSCSVLTIWVLWDMVRFPTNSFIRDRIHLKSLEFQIKIQNYECSLNNTKYIYSREFINWLGFKLKPACLSLSCPLCVLWIVPLPQLCYLLPFCIISLIDRVWFPTKKMNSWPYWISAWLFTPEFLCQLVKSLLHC